MGRPGPPDVGAGDEGGAGMHGPGREDRVRAGRLVDETREGPGALAGAEGRPARAATGVRGEGGDAWPVRQAGHSGPQGRRDARTADGGRWQGRRAGRFLLGGRPASHPGHAGPQPDAAEARQAAPDPHQGRPRVRLTPRHRLGPLGALYPPRGRAGTVRRDGQRPCDRRPPGRLPAAPATLVAARRPAGAARHRSRERLTRAGRPHRARTACEEAAPRLPFRSADPPAVRRPYRPDPLGGPPGVGFLGTATNAARWRSSTVGSLSGGSPNRSVVRPGKTLIW